jgi:hypothetical protein
MSESKTTESLTTSTQSCLEFIIRKQGNHENGEVEDVGNARVEHDDKVLTQEQTCELPDRVPGWQLKDDDPEVLDPDHPLMRRFQAALKNHLERQYSRLSEEVLELVSSIAISPVLGQ